MNLCGIYLIKNLSNDKIYIGKSINILKRWEQHIDSARLQKFDYEFYHDLINIQTFSFQILEICSQEELQEKEQYYIDYYQSLYKGYNQVQAIDITKQESLLLHQSILDAIWLLVNTDLYYKEIAEKTGLSVNTILNINRCKSYTQYHNYKNNIREECGRKRYYDKGELNPRSKLSEQEVLEIVELLKYTDLTAQQIADKFNISRSAINNINLRKNWTYLTTEFNKNIRKEFKNRERVKIK